MNNLATKFVLLFKSIAIIALAIFGVSVNKVQAASACNPPALGNWVITQSCDITDNVAVRGNITVRNNSTLTILSNQVLSINFTQFRLHIENGSKVIIKKGARIFRHPVHDIYANNTDGTFGYYLKRVNGGVVEAFNENVSFYPASTIKALESVHALRQVQNNPDFNLNTTTLMVCPGNNTNCSNNANSTANCNGVTPINEVLQTSILRMMVPSDNESTNAIQEFFGNGNAQNGRVAMNQTAHNVIGMSGQTALNHKFNCDNVSNNPANSLTLTDIGLLYEQVATNTDVLKTNFRNTFYNLMKNETGGLIRNQQEFFFSDVISKEGQALGMSNTQISNFRRMVRLAHKAGTIGSNYRSVGGWIQLPINGGTQNRQYVYGHFVDSATFNNFTNINNISDALLREVIRKAMEDF